MEPVFSDLPVLPIRNAVIFPAISIPLIVGRERSLKALEQSLISGNLLIVVTQRVVTPGDPSTEDLFSIGTLSRIESITDMESFNRQAMVTGIARYRIEKCEVSAAGYLFAKGEIIPDVQSPNTPRNEALFQSLKEAALEIVMLLPSAPEPLLRLIERVDDPSYLCNICSAYLNLTLFQKQELLETSQVERRMETLLTAMRKEHEILDIQKEIRDKMTERMNKAQREAILREQLRTIRSELGEEGSENVADDLEQKLKNANLPEEAAKQADEELQRLRNLPTSSAEYHVIHSYLEWIAAVPWNNSLGSPASPIMARGILNEDHFGLEDVKKRILQFLAVTRLRKDLQGPILCLVGPPGVGKTSLGQSIARALGRKFVRASLGGIRDEAEIRGHRRTYVGAMPGRIIQSLKRVKCSNPLMLLDEIDKLQSDFHGDPSAAMLEVLDPEQNKSFVDHYLDLPFDLSRIFFITTANISDTIPAALKDRMEIIEIQGYTPTEKLEIAKHFLLPKLLTEHGIESPQVEIPDESIQKIILNYTREAGVRELERKIAALLRVAAERIVYQDSESWTDTSAIALGPDCLEEHLGPPRFLSQQVEDSLKPGVAMALAWTPHGGELLFVESKALSSGKGNLILTGQLGEVMKESAHIALSLIRTMIEPVLHQKEFDFSTQDIHIHVPGGAIPKDGPSAGLSILSSLASLVLSRPLDSHVAMTGEITLRGNILPVGGIKEKLLAAHRSGLTHVVLPRKNQPDLTSIPEEIRKALKFTWVDTVEETLDLLLALKAESSETTSAR